MAAVVGIDEPAIQGNIARNGMVVFQVRILHITRIELGCHIIRVTGGTLLATVTYGSGPPRLLEIGARLGYTIMRGLRSPASDCLLRVSTW